MDSQKVHQLVLPTPPMAGPMARPDIVSLEETFYEVIIK
jgi:hypothetical protein